MTADRVPKGVQRFSRTLESFVEYGEARVKINSALSRRRLLWIGMGGASAAVISACGQTVEVIREVPVEVIKEVEVPGGTTVVEVEKEIIREVEVPGETTIVEIEKEVPVEVRVEVPAMVETVEISYWENEMIPGWAELIGGFVEEFEGENPHIKVDWQITDWGAYRPAIFTAAGAGQLPDIWHTNYSQNAGFIDVGIVHPLDEFLTKDFIDQFFPGHFTLGVERDGKIYGLVNGGASRGFYYNKALFAEAGVADPPETYDQMVEAAVKISSLPDSWGYVLQTAGPQGEQDFIWRHWSNGGEIITPEKKQAIANESGYDAMQFMLDLVDAGATQPNVVDTDYQQKIDLFMGGNSGMMIGGSWWQANLVDGDIDWGTAPIPRSNFAFNQLVVNDYLMSATSEHKDAAWALMEKSAEDKWAVSRDKEMYLSPFKKTYTSDPFFSTAEWQPFFANLDNTKAMPGDVPKWPAMQEELQAQMQLVMLGDKTAINAVDDTAAQWDKLLEED